MNLNFFTKVIYFIEMDNVGRIKFKIFAMLIQLLYSSILFL